MGYTLDEIRNDITRETPACFEPTIDYVVTKVPRFAFEKFAAADDTLGTQMKSVGEAMSIGKTFKQSFQKALRSLETGRAGFGADGKDGRVEQIADDELEERCHAADGRPDSSTSARRFRRGWTVERVHELTGIDPWFLRQLEELAAYEDEIRSAGSLAGLTDDAAAVPAGQGVRLFRPADRVPAGCERRRGRGPRESRSDCMPSYGLVDTCAAEFVAYTPYFYSTYGDVQRGRPRGPQKIMILGGGPNRIGQGIEFDYCCVHAVVCAARRRVRDHHGQQQPGDRQHGLRHQRPALLRAADAGGRAAHLPQRELLGRHRAVRRPDAAEPGGRSGAERRQHHRHEARRIEAAEDRKFFQELVTRLGIRQPENGVGDQRRGGAERSRSGSAIRC